MFCIKSFLVSGIFFAACYSFSLPAMQSSPDSQLQIAFQEALDAHEFEKAKICLEQGANPSAICLRQFSHADPALQLSVLEHYASDGTAEQVKFLLEHGADPFYRDSGGGHALQRTIFNTSKNALKIVPLLVKQVGPNYPIGGLFPRTLLNDVIEHFDLFPQQDRACLLLIAELLLELGADQTPLTPKQVSKLKEARDERGQMLAYRDCYYLGHEYPYPGEDQLEEDQLPYKDLYDSELLKYIPLPEPVAKICADYSDNAELGALLDSAYADAEAGEQRSSL